MVITETVNTVLLIMVLNDYISLTECDHPLTTG
jgi:hypothetical protein